MMYAARTMKKQNRRRPRHFPVIPANQRTFVHVATPTQVSNSLPPQLPDDVKEDIVSQTIAASQADLFTDPMKRDVRYVLSKQLQFSNKEEERGTVAASKVESMFSQVERTIYERSERRVSAHLLVHASLAGGKLRVPRRALRRVAQGSLRADAELGAEDCGHGAPQGEDAGHS